MPGSVEGLTLNVRIVPQASRSRWYDTHPDRVVRVSLLEHDPDRLPDRRQAGPERAG
jgi:hypothetical protein